MWGAVAVAVAAALVLLALVVRYIVLQLAYGRRVVITAGVLAMMIAALAVLVAALAGGTAAVLAVALGAIGVAAVLVLGVWVVAGASRDLILGQGELVARGLLMSARRNGREVVVDPTGTGVIVVAGGRPLHLLRVRTVRRDRKSLLFAQGLAKFVATAERGVSR